MRTLYLLGIGYAAVCGAVVLRTRQTARGGEPPAEPPAYTGSAGSWFQVVKPGCNAVEVETTLRQSPPPVGRDGAGYGAACLALAGKIDRARDLILALPQGDRGFASSIVFNIGHPVADAGDDRSAGPIMELVLEFWPDNYMALYHAGASEYVLGEYEKSKTRLHQFLDLYHENDGWRSNALELLRRMEAAQ